MQTKAKGIGTSPIPTPNPKASTLQKVDGHKGTHRWAILHRQHMGSTNSQTEIIYPSSVEKATSAQRHDQNAQWGFLTRHQIGWCFMDRKGSEALRTRLHTKKNCHKDGRLEMSHDTLAFNRLVKKSLHRSLPKSRRKIKTSSRKGESRSQWSSRNPGNTRWPANYH